MTETGERERTIEVGIPFDSDKQKRACEDET